MIRIKHLLFCVLLGCSVVLGVPTNSESLIKPILINEAPVIDGNLSEATWQSTPLLTEDFLTYWPSYGEALPQKTEVWATYDSDNLYFAFYCFDHDPRLIKTSTCSRDHIWGDDWVGIGLDAVGNNQGMYGFFVNPNGIQGDQLRLASTDNWDRSVDWVWYAGAQVVEDGYVVEVQVPLKSIRFHSGDDVEMKILFFRQITRLNLQASWPEIPVGQGWLNSTQSIFFDHLNRQQKIEVLPSVTSGSIWDRENPNAWSSAETNNELGVSVKYGITSSITAEATYNPDFSQVETDAFQIQVNQRYPNFYTEKRPFFMETSNLFNLAGTSGESNLMTAVHSRRIVDPEWGVKLTGEAGKTTFAVLAAGDEWAGRQWVDEVNPHLGRNANYFVGRMKRTLQGENYIGVLYSGRELADDYNRVVAADFRFRFKDHHSLSGNAIYSTSNQTNDNGKSDGAAFHLEWNYNSRPFESMLFLEHYDKNFNMETAFYRRTGVTNLYYYICPLWYLNTKGFPWIRRLRTFTFGFYIHDWETGMDDYFTQLVINPFMSWNGWFRGDINLHAESWGGVQYKKKFSRFWGSAQFTKWLRYFTILRVGDLIYYDKIDHFMGTGVNWRNTLTLQPTDNFNQEFTYLYETLRNPETDLSQYDVHILQSKTTYQFNEYFFIRAQVQYDSYRKVILSDFLASFTLIPGTVMHLGYGSLHEHMRWQQDQWRIDSVYGKYVQSARSLFFKASYRFRF